MRAIYKRFTEEANDVAIIHQGLQDCSTWIEKNEQRTCSVRPVTHRLSFSPRKIEMATESMVASGHGLTDERTLAGSASMACCVFRDAQATAAPEASYAAPR